jgi:hypothetical protein
MSLAPKGSRSRTLWGTLLLVLAVPVLVYFVVRPFVGDDASALGYTAAAELLISLSRTVVRRRWSVWSALLALTAIVWLGGAFVLTVNHHGATLPFELERPTYSGIVGLVFLVSAAVGRPVGGSYLSRRAERKPSKRMTNGIVAGVGGVFVLEALIVVGLAFALPPATFVVASRVVDLFLAVLAAFAPIVLALIWASRQSEKG